MAEASEVFRLRGARVYVAGHRGMVGSACARRLAAEGCEVLTSDRATVDIRRQAEVEAFIAQARPDAVVVAAAKVGGKRIARDKRHVAVSREARLISVNITPAGVLNNAGT